jgi:[ribosomal protein S5]-alanine N-acetyltransferase
LSGDFSLRTDRLLLRPLRASDAEALNLIQSDPDHMRFYPHPFSVGETEAWISRNLVLYPTRGYGLWAIEDRRTGEFLGNCGPVHQQVDGADELELGWSVTPLRSGQGIATEAAEACRDWCWAELAIDHLIALVRPENVQSARVAEKIGMNVWKRTRFGSENRVHDVYRVDRPG